MSESVENLLNEAQKAGEPFGSETFTTLKKDVLNKLIDSLGKVDTRISALKDDDFDKMADPFGILEVRKTSKAEFEKKWNSIKEKLDKIDLDLGKTIENGIKTPATATASATAGASTTNVVSSLVASIDPKTNKSLSLITTKLEELLESKETKKTAVIQEGNFDKIKKNTGLSDDVLKKFYSMAFDQKKKKAPLSQELYEVGPKKFELDEKSILDITKKLKLTGEETDSLLKELVTEEKEQKSALRDFLKAQGEGLFKTLTELFALLAVGITALIFGKPLLGMVDKMFGTNLSEAFDNATSSLQKFSGYILDGSKALLMAITVLTQSLKLFAKVLTSPVQTAKMVLDATKVTAAGVASRSAALFGAKKPSVPLAESKYTFNEKTGRWHDKVSNKMVKSSVVEAEKAAGNVGKMAVKAGGTAAKGAASASAEASSALGGALAKTGTKAVAKAGLGALLKGGLGFIFRKIPFIGAIIDFAAAISDFTQGDTVGGVLRTIGGIGNLLSIIPGFGLIGFGVSMAADFLDDMLTEKAGGKGEKKSWGLLWKTLTDIGRSVTKKMLDFMFYFAPSWVKDPIYKALGLETSDSSSDEIPEPDKSKNENQEGAAKPSPHPTPSPKSGKGENNAAKPDATTSSPQPTTSSPETATSSPETATSSPEAIKSSEEISKQFSPEAIMAMSPEVMETIKKQTGGRVDLQSGEISKSLMSYYGLPSGETKTPSIKDLTKNNDLPTMTTKSIGLDNESVEKLTSVFQQPSPAISLNSNGGNSKDDDIIIIASRNDHLDHNKNMWRYSPLRLARSGN